MLSSLETRPTMGVSWDYLIRVTDYPNLNVVYFVCLNFRPININGHIRPFFFVKWTSWLVWKCSVDQGSATTWCVPSMSLVEVFNCTQKTPRNKQFKPLLNENPRIIVDSWHAKWFRNPTLARYHQMLANHWCKSYENWRTVSTFCPSRA